MSVSIILPCYNVSDVVERVFLSIINQTIGNWEAIFINDGSTDNTLEQLYKIQNKDDRVKILSQHNQGSGLARNAGVKLAKGKYLYFMDPDDEIFENTLEQLLYIAEKNRAEVVICGYKEVDLVTKKIKDFKMLDDISFNTNKEVREIYFELLSKKLFNPPWNKLYLSRFWKENNLQYPNVKKGQDALLNMDAFKKLNKLVVTSQILYLYYIGREGSAQTTLSDSDFEYFKINQEWENRLFDFWGNSELERRYTNKRLINFCFSDSMKVYRFVKSNNGGIKQFLEIWRSRECKDEIKRINSIYYMNDQIVFLKLVSMKIPILNYLIQYMLNR